MREIGNPKLLQKRSRRIEVHPKWHLITNIGVRTSPHSYRTSARDSDPRRSRKYTGTPTATITIPGHVVPAR